MYDDTELAAALQQAKGEFLSKTAGKSALTVEETYELREYAKSRTAFSSDDLTAEQAAWMVLYEDLTDQLRKTAPEMMRQVEPLEEELHVQEALRDAIASKLKASPIDHKFTVSFGFLIVGCLIGWFLSVGIWVIFLVGFVSWIAGVLFSIFALDSPYVQSVIAIRLNRVGLKHLARWLYDRALTLH
jgi:hypothetical protein